MTPRMILIRLEAVLEKKGKSMYWLAKTSGVPHNTLRNMAKKDSQRRIDLWVLSKMCAALDCLPGEFFEFLPDEEDKAISQLAKAKERGEKVVGSKKMTKKKGDR